MTHRRWISLRPVLFAALVLGVSPGLAASPLQQGYLKASAHDLDDQWFGRSVAASGETVVVGAPLYDFSGANQGAAYVFVWTGTSWSEQAVLLASNAAGGDDFGRAVSISGDTIVVGAPNEDSGATGVDGDQRDDSSNESGAAYVFVRSGSTWSQQAYLKASNTDPGGGDFFGRSVAVSGDTIVIGAPGEDSSATGVDGDQGDESALESGAAYVFVRNGTAWTQQAYLKASNTDSADGFGAALALDDALLVVGARMESSSATGVNGDEDDDSAAEAGAAYVFVRAAGTWSQEAYLKASNAQHGDRFAEAVSLAGETIVVGAAGEDGSATGVDGDDDDLAFSSGAAYVFVRTGTSWSQEAYLKASNTGADDGFGSSVAVAGDTILVGTPAEDGGDASPLGDPDDDDAPEAGAVYAFVREGTGWRQRTYLKAPNVGAGDRFGQAVGLSGDAAIVGASHEDSDATGVDGDQDDDDGTDSGAAYAFDLPETFVADRYCSPAVPNSTGSPGRLTVIGSPVAADDDLRLRASALPVAPGPALNLGYFVMGTGTNAVTPPGSAGPLCVAPGLQRYLPPPQNTEELPDGGFERVVGTSGPVSSLITAGSTWNFQAWHRDLTAGTSNFTDAVSVTFR